MGFITQGSGRALGGGREACQLLSACLDEVSRESVRMQRGGQNWERCNEFLNAGTVGIFSYLWPGSAFCLRIGVMGFVLGKQGVERRGRRRLERENANTRSSPRSSARALTS